MACNHPLPAWYAKQPNEKTGRTGITFTHGMADTSRPVELPCGRCIGCRLDKARQWAVRMIHEAKTHRHNYFITLTYNDASLPLTVQGLPTLRPQDFVLFMKRLRQHYARAEGGDRSASPLAPPGEKETNRIRFYQCGEYGERTLRPHHHLILFNCPITDLKPVTTRARNAHTLYNSKTISELWGLGHTVIGGVTFETAAYTAAYVTKKITGPAAADHYRGRYPEYATMSRRPGLGRGFLETYWEDVFPSDTIIIRGHPIRPPKYYVTRLQQVDQDLYQEVKDQRELKPKRTVRHRERTAREVNLTQRQQSREPTR